MDFIEWIKEKSGDDSMKYVLAGGLVLVIVIALVSTISEYTGGPNTPDAPSEYHFWDVEKQQEYTLKPEEMEEHLEYGPMAMESGQLMWSPLTNDNTGVPMTRCPKCEKYFVPQSWANPEEGWNPEAKPVCTHCGTDLHEWYREQRRNR